MYEYITDIFRLFIIACLREIFDTKDHLTIFLHQMPLFVNNPPDDGHCYWPKHFEWVIDRVLGAWGGVVVNP